MSAELQAGRELDALVAERVMGLRKHRGDLWILSETTGQVSIDPPPYSTDIAAAWQVVEAILSRTGRSASPGGHEGYAERWTFNICDGWEASFEVEVALATGSSMGIYGYHNGGRGNAPTAPLAICIAALKVMEGGSQ